MTAEPLPDPPDEVPEQERRRLRARVFGDVLPEDTADDRAAGWGDAPDPADGSEEWLRRQVPPHHG